MLIYQHTEVYYLKIPPDGPSSAKQSWTCPQELRSPLSLRNPLFTAAQLRGVGLDRETAGALLSIFVPVCRWLCASQEMSLMFMSWHLLIPANPGLSASLSLLSSSPVLCPLFLGTWLEALLGAQLNGILHLHSLHHFFLMDCFSGTSESQLSFLQSTTGHCQHVSGPEIWFCWSLAWSSDPLIWGRAGTRSFECLQEAAAGIVLSRNKPTSTFLF